VAGEVRLLVAELDQLSWVGIFDEHEEMEQPAGEHKKIH